MTIRKQYMQTFILNIFKGPTLSSTFRGVGQIAFQYNLWSGVLFSFAIALTSPNALLYTLVGSLIGYLAGAILKAPTSALHGGLYGYNGALVGLATGMFFQPSVVALLLVVVASFATSAFMKLWAQYFPSNHLPPFTLPFLSTFWLISGTGLLEPVTFVTLLHGELNQWLQTGLATLHGVGQVFFTGSTLAAVIIVAGFIANSMSGAAWAIGASLIGYWIGQLLGADDPSLHVGLFGFNATLTAIALHIRYANHIVVLGSGVVLATLLTWLAGSLSLTVLTLPFIVATWATILIADRTYWRKRNEQPKKST
ncbi:urea transporter [Vibrio paucivorans]